MSDAVEGAEVMLYGVSKAYKESTNCRLVRDYSILILRCLFFEMSTQLLMYCLSKEANYAHQQEIEMIPLMMQEITTYEAFFLKTICRCRARKCRGSELMLACRSVG